MDLQYSDRDVGHLLGIWIVACGFLTLSTTRPDYNPLVGPVGDPVIFGSLFGVVLVGMVGARYRDVALGVPMAVCGGLVVWTVLRTLVVESLLLTTQTASVVGGLLIVGGLFVREGLLITLGRRHDGRGASEKRQSPPRTRWGWWLGALLLVVLGTAGVL